MENENYLIISPDIDVLYVDPESCCYSAYGDEISNEGLELGPLFCFAMPGIEEWQKRYEYATDFSETTTDPSFDWLTWHYEGLCFAKAIWEKMPRSITLYYQPPYEDRSKTIIGKIEINEHIDILIDQLRPRASHKVALPSFTDNLDFKAKRGDDEILLSLHNNRMQKEVCIPFSQLSIIRNWLKDIVAGNSQVCSCYISNLRFHFFKQTVGSHTEMGQLWIENTLTHEKSFWAYVNIKNFIKGFYLSLLTTLGFEIYKNVCEYPYGAERVRVWTPYNQFKSRCLESFIIGQNIEMFESETLVSETLVMFPDYGGCIFWDTMGMGIGDSDCICTDFADIELNVPGLEKWSEFYDNHDYSQSFEEYWNEGWELAKLVRKQLPENIDLFYMCYDPKQPDAKSCYYSILPKIIVPKQ